MVWLFFNAWRNQSILRNMKLCVFGMVVVFDWFWPEKQSYKQWVAHRKLQTFFCLAASSWHTIHSLRA